MECFSTCQERAEAAEAVMRKIGQQVCAGLREAHWQVPDLGAVCMLSSYEERIDYISSSKRMADEAPLVLSSAFYLMHASFREQRSGGTINALVDISPNFAQVKVGSEFWDQVMAVSDESLRHVLDELEPDKGPSARLRSA